MSGDNGLCVNGDMIQDILPNLEEASTLMALYVDVCITTYRCLHRPSVDTWLSAMEKYWQRRPSYINPELPKCTLRP